MAASLARVAGVMSIGRTVATSIGALRHVSPVAGTIALGVAVGAVTVLKGGELRGIVSALLIAFVLMVRIAGRRDQGWANGQWREYVVLAIALRMMAAVVHLVVAFYLFNQMVDFVGLYDWVQEAAERIVVGDFIPFEAFELAAGGYVAYVLMPLVFLVGASFLGMLLLASLIGFLGSYFFFRSYQIAGPADGDIGFLAHVMFFLPSFVFWGTLFGKDSAVFLALGGIAYCVARLCTRTDPRDVASVVLWLAVVAIIRPHMGAVLVVSFGVTWVLRRMTPRGPTAVLKPVWMAGRVLVLVVLIGVPAMLLSNLYRLVSIDAIFHEVARRHGALSGNVDDAGVGFGSSLPQRVSGDSPWEFVAYLPEGFVTFLFRPLPFDAHNAQALVASMEGTLLLGITIVRRRQLWASLRLARSNPYLMMCALYFFLGTALLCFERNLGVIARHRVMTLPFLMLLLAAPRPATRPATAGRVADAPVDGGLPVTR